MAKGNSSSATNSRVAAAANRDAATRQVLSNESIGEAAGQVWQLLDSEGPQSVPSIKKTISAPDDVVLAAIGWLAREDKLSFSKSGRSLTISLR
jgi:hypothetical protein